MKQLELRPEATEDFLTIWSYSEEHWGEAQADRYTAAIRDVLNGLSTGRTRSSPSIIADFRIKAVGSHVIYFTEAEDRLVVVRILHGRMDAERHILR